jgi:hypothetical protein
MLLHSEKVNAAIGNLHNYMHLCIHFSLSVKVLCVYGFRFSRSNIIFFYKFSLLLNNVFFLCLFQLVFYLTSLSFDNIILRDLFYIVIFFELLQDPSTNN